MYYLLLFSPSITLADEITALLSRHLKDTLCVENAGPLQGPAAIFPKGTPSAFLLDVHSCPDQDAYSWFRLLCSQHSHIPALVYDDSTDLQELVLPLLYDKAFLPVKNGEFVSYSQGQAFLERLSILSHTNPGSGLQLPNLSGFSFSACLLRAQKKTPELLNLCRLLTHLFHSSFCYYNNSLPLFLFVLFEPTGNFTQLERNRQLLIDRLQSGKDSLPMFCLGVIHHDIAGLTSSFLEACEVYYVNSYQRPCSIFEEISSPPGQMLKPQKLMEIERSIRTDIQFREGSNALQYSRQWFAECRALNYELNDMKYDLIILYSSIKYVLFDMYGLKLKRIKSGLEVHEIISITQASQLEDWFCTWLIYTLDNFDLTRSNTGFQIQEVLQFITNHIMEDLSLNTIASYFYVNPSYFSTLFKRETGQTYISYITKLKMDKAAELIAANCKIYEAAHMLGYEDIRHFRNTFKKYHGISPSQIKAHHKTPDGKA